MNPEPSSQKHQLSLATRAQELSDSIGKINLRDANAQNWAQYLKQFAVLSLQLQTLANEVFASAEDVETDKLFVFQPLVDSFMVSDLLPARPTAEVFEIEQAALSKAKESFQNSESAYDLLKYIDIHNDKCEQLSKMIKSLVASKEAFVPMDATNIRQGSSGDVAQDTIQMLNIMINGVGLTS